MNKKQISQYEQIKAHGENLLHLFPNATERDPIALCKKLRRLETKASRITTDYCNGDFDAGENGEKLDAALDAILAKVNALLGNVHEYQPKTGARCTCRPGIARDNCATCEGTGLVVDFAAIRNRLDLVPVFVNRDPRGYALKIEEEATRELRAHGKPIHSDWGGYGILAPDFIPAEG